MGAKSREASPCCLTQGGVKRKRHHSHTLSIESDGQVALSTSLSDKISQSIPLQLSRSQATTMELDPGLYTVAWITSLEIESRAAARMFDHSHVGRFPIQRGNDLVYQAGQICGHNVIIVQLPASHNLRMRSATKFADEIQRFFPKVCFRLLIGLAAGLPRLTGPSPRDIRLGDILVAQPRHSASPRYSVYCRFLSEAFLVGHSTFFVGCVGPGPLGRL